MYLPWDNIYRHKLYVIVALEKLRQYLADYNQYIKKKVGIFAVFAIRKKTKRSNVACTKYVALSMRCFAPFHNNRKCPHD